MDKNEAAKEPPVNVILVSLVFTTFLCECQRRKRMSSLVFICFILLKVDGGAVEWNGEDYVAAGQLMLQLIELCSSRSDYVQTY